MYEVVLYVVGTPRTSKQSPLPPHTILSFSSPGIGFGREGGREGGRGVGGGRRRGDAKGKHGRRPRKD